MSTAVATATAVATVPAVVASLTHAFDTGASEWTIDARDGAPNPADPDARRPPNDAGPARTERVETERVLPSQAQRDSEATEPLLPVPAVAASGSRDEKQATQRTLLLAACSPPAGFYTRSGRLRDRTREAGLVPPLDFRVLNQR